MPGLSGLGWSGIRVVPVDVGAVRGCPVLVDFDEDGGGEAEQGIAVGEDADLAGAALDLLLDQAAPLAEWDLPTEFQTLRRLMEARMIKAGRLE